MSEGQSTDADQGGGSGRKKLSERQKARRMILQALYQWQMAGAPVRDIEAEFLAYYQGRIDRDYFREIFAGVTADAAKLDEQLRPMLDRSLEKLDPIEHCLLQMGLYELSARMDVPYKVVINEAVELARVFGATESHKYVNSILDRAAKTHRTLEQRGTG